MMGRRGIDAAPFAFVRPFPDALRKPGTHLAS
jgi:hypothetical protein